MCRGSILMETVIVMPILLLLIFGIIQTAMIWTGKQLTVYAAYCAARSITVVRAPENESDIYGAREQDEAAARAARLALAWLCFFDRGSRNRISIPGWGAIQGSGSMNDRIRVRILERGISDARPFVTVEVKFRMSLMMPVMGVDVMMAKAADKDVEPSRSVYRGREGFYETLARASAGAKRYLGLPYIDFTEVCSIPMPYSTRNFPRGAYDWTDAN